MAVIPQNIGKYKIDSLLGKGGMGEVYKAHDANLGRFVALKIMRGPAMDDSQARERFTREAQAAGGLRHPNIVTIYDLGEIDEQLFIAMEFIVGEDLEKIIKSKRPLTIEEKLNIMIQVCEGIGYAHKHQIVHRDLKPSNIRIDDEGVVKIMDFGIAKVESSNMTATGTVMGTPYYMSPEQVRGLKVDSRSDIFSLGAILYEVFTYRKAFEGEIAAVFYKIVHEQPLPISTYVDVEAEPIQKIIDRCLQKDKGQRIQTCHEMADLLRAALNIYREGNVATVIGIKTTEGGPDFRLPTAPSAVTKSTTGSGTGAPRPSAVEQATEIYGQSTPPPLSATKADPTEFIASQQPPPQPSYSPAAPPIPEVTPETRATKKQNPLLFVAIVAVLLAGAVGFYFYYKHSTTQEVKKPPTGPTEPKPEPSPQQPDITAEIAKAKALHQEGKYDAAVQIYSGLIQKYPSDANLHFLLGAAEKKMRKNNEALL
jgi:serine/threonine protein kinase